MKTAQEKVAKFSLPNANWIGLVEQIQLDAFKEGMNAAADIVMRERSQPYTEDRNPLSVLVDLQKIIRTTAGLINKIEPLTKGEA